MTNFELEQRLDRVVADLEIRRLMHEYAASIDARDWDRLRAVFADDVVIDYHNGRTIVNGGDNAVAYVQENTGHLAWQHHNVSPYAIDVEGVTAHGRTYLLSHQMIAAEPGVVVTMVANYDGEYVRVGGVWRISRLVHMIKLTNYVPLHSAPVGVHIPPAVAP